MIGLGTPDLLGKHKHIVEIAMYHRFRKKNSALWKIISAVYRLKKKKLLLGVSVGNY